MFLSALSDPNKPTFFEMSMIKRMMESLRPAFDHSLAICASHSEVVLTIAPWGDEIYYTILGLIQSHYLCNYDGSFAEYFFNLKRALAPPVSIGSLGVYRVNTVVRMAEIKKNTGRTNLFRVSPMRNKDKLMSVIFLVFFPYIATKLRKQYEMLTPTESSPGDAHNYRSGRSYLPWWNWRLAWSTSSPHGGICKALYACVQRMCFYSSYRWGRIMRWAFPICSTIQELTSLAFQTSFLFGYSRYFSLLSWCSGIIVCRQTLADMKSNIRKAETSRNAAGWNGTIGRIAAGLRVSLLLSFVTFKFVEWWFSNNVEERLRAQRRSAYGKIAGVPPPIAPKIGGDVDGKVFMVDEVEGGPMREIGSPAVIEAPRDVSSCAICNRRRRNDAMSSSGFLFCYPCIHAYAKRYGKCPLTSLSCTTAQVQRVYMEKTH